jgi:hypothetical protein
VFSCKEKPKMEDAHFGIIEISHYNGWTHGTTVYIDSTWIIKRCDYVYHINSYIDTSDCYIDTLDNELRQLVNSKIDELKNIAIDTLYDGNCRDCGGFLVRLGYENKLFKSIIIDDDFNNDLTSFCKFITSIMINQNKIDSMILFETTKQMIPPAPIISTVKYLPPPIDSLRGRK